MKLFANLKKRNRILLYAALVIVALWGYYNLFYLPHLKDARRLRKDIANLEAIIKTMKDAGVTTVDSSVDIFRLKLREKEFSNLEERLNQLEKKLLGKNALSSCLSELTGLCNKCRIEVGFFAPQPEKEINSELPYHGLPVELNVNTTWQDIIAFLEELQHLSALAILKDIDLKVDKERPPCVRGKLILELWLKKD